jgi:hypothetical protein
MHKAGAQHGEVPLTLHRPDAFDVPRSGESSAGSLRGVVSQLVRFTGIGVVMTLAYLVLYASLQGTLGMQGANVVAWVATRSPTPRRTDDSPSGSPGGAAPREHRRRACSCSPPAPRSPAVPSAYSAPTVASPGEALQSAVLVGATVAAGLLRFTLLRRWVLAPRRLARRVRPALTDGMQTAGNRGPDGAPADRPDRAGAQGPANPPAAKRTVR